MHVIGNKQVKQILDRFVKEGVPPVLLFEGPSGVGKRLFAKQMICDLFQGDERVNKDTHPDVVYVDHQVDKMRQLLYDVETYPFEAPYRFYFIDGIDEMLPVHMNALLKTFEEAPLFNRFILFATHIDRVLPTILSRAVPIHFASISNEEMQSYFSDLSPEVSAKIAALSGGSIGKAKALISEGFLEYYPIVLEALKYHFMQDYIQFYKTLDEINNMKETTTTKELFNVVYYWLLDLYALEQELNRPLFFPEEKENLIRCKHLLQKPLPHMLSTLQKAKEGMVRHIRFSKCLEYVLINIS